MLYFSSWENVRKNLINSFCYLPEFGSTTFVYHGKTFRWHVSFIWCYSNYFQWKVNFCSILWRPVSLSLSLSSSLEDYGSQDLLFKGKLGLDWGGLDENTLFCHFWPNMRPHFDPQKAKIWNFVSRILFFSPLERLKLYY